jgi:hypothetical protein
LIVSLIALQCHFLLEFHEGVAEIPAYRTGETPILQFYFLFINTLLKHPLIYNFFPFLACDERVKELDSADIPIEGISTLPLFLFSFPSPP